MCDLTNKIDHSMSYAFSNVYAIYWLSSTNAWIIYWKQSIISDKEKHVIYMW